MPVPSSPGRADGLERRKKSKASPKGVAPSPEKGEGGAKVPEEEEDRARGLDEIREREEDEAEWEALREEDGGETSEKGDDEGEKVKELVVRKEEDKER
jgi:hypothetical protein